MERVEQIYDKLAYNYSESVGTPESPPIEATSDDNIWVVCSEWLNRYILGALSLLLSLLLWYLTQLVMIDQVPR